MIKARHVTDLYICFIHSSQSTRSEGPLPTSKTAIFFAHAYSSDKQITILDFDVEGRHSNHVRNEIV